MVSSKSITRLRWSVAGRRGKQIHGFAPADPHNAPSVVINTFPLHWEFSFRDVSGSGRVRIGSGCDYNPLQMVEALYTHLAHDIDPDEAMNMLDREQEARIEFDKDATSFSFDPEDWL